jgi:hypothetical protein
MYNCIQTGNLPNRQHVLFVKDVRRGCSIISINVNQSRVCFESSCFENGTNSLPAELWAGDYNRSKQEVKKQTMDL